MPQAQIQPRLQASLHAPTPSLVLIGRRELRSNNSWMHNLPRLMRGPGRCTVQANPADAPGLKSGDLVELRTATGTVQAALELTDDLMPGVISLPHGFGHHRAGIRQAVAQAHAGVSANDLTDPARLDILTGNAALNGTPVELRPAN